MGNLIATIRDAVSGAVIEAKVHVVSAGGQYISPSNMNLAAAALPIIWVAVGGRKDLTATLVGTLVVLGIFQNLTIYGSYYAFVIMGLLLVVVVVFLPEGLIPGLVKLFGRHRKRKEGMS